VCAKAASKMLVKLTPGINFTNILQAVSTDPKSAIKTDGLIVFLRSWNLKLITVVNFSTILRAAFAPIFAPINYKGCN